eukprot:CAMPEP_0197891842 /NCGR_PEP_ID=MMETSP1439-20131203/29830_1 /TAXON_ID=66791 /ORGANISM="Gonyaulax spinifera, Strain CCMP409" /LENGTH=318 /DNA_ID=CAMNT_0043511977 /DNA_START=30 /DNA_END=984 /DNA_ORIENTATION=+
MAARFLAIPLSALWATLAEGGGLRIAAESTQLLVPPQPVLASRFHATFTEHTHGLKPWGQDSVNTGSYHYDFAKGRQVWSHGKGQGDNWCQCAGLSTDEPCDLLATKELETAGATYAIFKSLNKCCKIGDWAHGFGPLRPDWLRATNATYLGEKKVGNRTCFEWAGGPPGDWFTMISDDWSLDAKGVPCTYEDKFKTFWKALGLKHIMFFDEESYSEDAEEAEVMAIPSGMDCSQIAQTRRVGARRRQLARFEVLVIEGRLPVSAPAARSLRGMPCHQLVRKRREPPAVCPNGASNHPAVVRGGGSSRALPNDHIKCQ